MKLELPPFRKTEAEPPSGPVRPMAMPVENCRASVSATDWRASISSLVMTETGAVVWSASIGSASAVTMTLEERRSSRRVWSSLRCSPSGQIKNEIAGNKGRAFERHMIAARWNRQAVSAIGGRSCLPELSGGVAFRLRGDLYFSDARAAGIRESFRTDAHPRIGSVFVRKMLTARKSKRKIALRRGFAVMFSSAPSRAGVEGWPGAWKRSLRLADFAGLLAWRQFSPV